MIKRYFNYKDISELEDEINQLSLNIRLKEKVELLKRPVKIGNKQVGNSLGIHPMEGCDGTLDGKPSELTYRRWIRFGKGGAKLIWGEATAILDEGRANPRQLLINERNAKGLEVLLSDTRQVHREKFGQDNNLLIGIQLTHSGRYSYRKPFIAFHHPLVDKITYKDKKRKIPISDDYPVVSDDYLEELEEHYVEKAKLAWNIGFDFIDVKQCHTYLLSELLAAKTRNGKYGGSLKNRTRFIRNVVKKIRSEVPELIIATRINVYDGLPYLQDSETSVGIPFDYETPYMHGFGVDENNPLEYELTEPIEVIGMLKELGVEMVNVSMGSPYFNPHIGRPFELPPVDGYLSPEHPLVGVDRLFKATAEIQQSYPQLVIVGTGYSWLREYFVNAAEANIRDGKVTIVSLGRGAFAYPEFAKDCLTNDGIDSKRICLADSYCTALMRAKHNKTGQYPSGCAVRDSLYQKVYQECRKKPKDF